MPIEIRELNIKATVTEETEKSAGEVDIGEWKEEILEECVEIVLQILEDKKKR